MNTYRRFAHFSAVRRTFADDIPAPTTKTEYLHAERGMNLVVSGFFPYCRVGHFLEPLPCVTDIRARAPV